METIDLKAVYRPLDGVIEIGIGDKDDEAGLRKLTIFENDRPYCYTKMGTVYIDDNDVVVCIEIVNFITPANYSYCQRVLSMMNKKIDVKSYTESEFKE